MGKGRGGPEDTSIRGRAERKPDETSESMQILWIHPPTLKCPPYGKKCSECGRMSHISAVCRGPRQAVHKLEEHEDGQINMVNTDHIICNAKDQV